MIQKTSLAIIVLLFALCGNVFAQKTRYLQVSTNPSTVDLYVKIIYYLTMYYLLFIYNLLFAVGIYYFAVTLMVPS